MEKRKIIMDCDPGVDDAIALAYAAAHPEAFELLAVTSVTGNQTIQGMHWIWYPFTGFLFLWQEEQKLPC